VTVGKVWLVGAGPGDPGLITVRGLEVLRRAEVVLYDTLAHPALLEAAPQAEQRDVGKRYGSPSASQAEINRDLRDLFGEALDDVELEVGSPGMGRPFRVMRQSQKEKPGFSQAKSLESALGLRFTMKTALS